MSSLAPSTVYCSRACSTDYGQAVSATLPELPSATVVTPALLAFRSLLKEAGLDAERFGMADWNPLSTMVREGDRVVVKPNWVRDTNPSGGGLDCLITHTSVLEAVLHYLVRARPASIVIGDAPIQGCDFAALRRLVGVDRMVEQFVDSGAPVSVQDFRCVVLPGGKLGTVPEATSRSLDQCVLFDLGRESVLEPISRDSGRFRVTMYDPDKLARTHGPGRHQYAVAREVIEADVVISVPKLKTHKKAGITGALKSLVGINGHKEYLPHHRKGGSETGGDCYEGGSWVKSLHEDLFDATNRATSPVLRSLYANACRGTALVERLLGLDRNVDGSWYGNDTVWRTCLDLQRILHYGRVDGSLADSPQRRILTVTDAIIAGEGNGPLSPTPIELGLMTLGTSPVAVEWAHAYLMGLDPNRIALLRDAFREHSRPLVDFAPGDVLVQMDGRTWPADEFGRQSGQKFRPPDGWIGHCELTDLRESAEREH